MTPLLTIGLPFLNSRATLADAVRSIFAQTFTDWELLLVDDGSSDGSTDIAKRLRDERVRVLSDGSHQGLVGRLNQIALMARGELLARMDSDDLMHPARLARQVERLRSDPTLQVIGTSACVLDTASRPTGLRRSAPPDLRPWAILKRGLFLHPTITGRTAWFRENPYDPRYVRAEDHELWCRAFARGRFATIDAPLYFYREERVNLANYLASCRTDRKILRDYGPALVGRTGAACLIALSCLKSTLYLLLTPLGGDRYLVRRRSEPLDEEARAHARREIDVILGTPLPGVDDPLSVHP